MNSTAQPPNMLSPVGHAHSCSQGCSTFADHLTKHLLALHDDIVALHDREIEVFVGKEAKWSCDVVEKAEVLQRGAVVPNEEFGTTQSGRYLNAQTASLRSSEATAIATSAHPGDRITSSGIEAIKEETDSTRIQGRCSDRRAFAVLSQVWQTHYDLVKQAERSHVRSAWTTGFSDKHRSNYPRRENMEWTSSRIAVHPKSKKRMAWTYMSLLLVLYDVVMVPMVFFFEMSPVLFVTWFARFFWSLDIAASFISGVYVNGTLQMDLTRIARAYAKSWFAFDLAVLVSEWVIMAIEANASSMSLLRTVRVLRLMRLVRIHKLKVVLSAVFSTSSEGVLVYLALVRTTCILLTFIHFLAGLLYKLGRDRSDGWVRNEPGMENAAVLRLYITSMHYAVTQLHGTSIVQPRSVFDQFISTSSIFICYVISAHYLGRTIHSVFLLFNSNAAELESISRCYVRDHHIDHDHAMRLKSFVSAYCEQEGLCERMEREAKLFAVLPAGLQYDLHQAAREPIIVNMLFLLELQEEDRRVSRRLCREAVRDMALLAKDVAFYTGDVCTSMVFVSTGILNYHHGANEQYEHRVSLVKLIHYSGLRGTPTTSQIVQPGHYLSEPVLWTRWEQHGQLYAIEDSSLLLMDSTVFARVITDYELASMLAVKYGRKYIWHLNNTTAAWSDLIKFDIAFDTLDDVLPREDEHLIFLSHYKEEAGTEATLMHEALERMVCQDVTSLACDFLAPVFIDTKDLEDLRELQDHVKRTHNLVLLLTPGVLSRPWCLVEIATAVQHEVELVPVEIQRPGNKFEYPTEEFYENLIDGRFLTPAAVRILEEEGISLTDIAAAIRQVFMKIALPFSPQKSSSIRQAELSDILSRCHIRDAQQQKAFTL